MQTRETERFAWVYFALGSLGIGMLMVPLAFALSPGDDLRPTAPGLAIPTWLFGLIWTVIYPTLGIATWRIWQRRAQPGATETLLSFGLCYLFLLSFLPITAAAQKQLVTAMMDAVGLIFAYTAAWSYWRVERRAALWMAPLLCWMPITTALKWSTL